MYYFIQSFPVLICISVGLILFAIYLPVFYTFAFNKNLDATQIFDNYFIIFYNMVFFFIIPALIGKIVYRDKLKAVGLCLPENKFKALVLILLSLLITIPSMIYLSRNQQFHHFYSAAFSHYTPTKIILAQFTILPIFYFSEEFFFRGFLLINLWRKIGWHSFWITDLLFVWAHLGKPLVEFAFSVPVGILLAFLSIQTRSVYPAMFVHYCIGVTVLLVMTLGR